MQQHSLEIKVRNYMITGAMGHLQRNEVEIVLSTMNDEYRFPEFGILGVIFDNVPLVFVTEYKLPPPRWLSIIKPFNPTVWLILLIVIVVSSGFVLLFKKFESTFVFSKATKNNLTTKSHNYDMKFKSNGSAHKSEFISRRKRYKDLSHLAKMKSSYFSQDSMVQLRPSDIQNCIKLPKR